MEKVLSVYNGGMEKYTPRITTKDTQKNSWFNKTCCKTVKRKDTVWNKWRKREK